MRLSFDLEERGAVLNLDGRRWLEGIDLDLIIDGRRYSTSSKDLNRVESWPLASEDALGTYRGLGLVYRLESTELLELRLKAYEEKKQAIIELETLQELQRTAVADSFLNTTFNLILHLKDGRFLLYTWGLRHAGEKGHWPEAVVGDSLKELPEEPFAPLVMWTDNGALAIAPLNYFLISPLRPFHQGAQPAIARGLHGAVNSIPQGMTLLTGLGVASEPDPVAALYALGDLLLKAGGKERGGPLDGLILKRLGYWNDYGAYYAALFSGIDEEKLRQLADYFKEEKIPVGYFGLDLWYRYEQIGWAMGYEPQRERFPRGLGPLAAETGLPFLLHLSAFARDFQGGNHRFIQGEHASYPAEPARFYRHLGRRLKKEGAVGVWHDWLWAQQSSVKELRADPEAAERWFAEMAEAFNGEELPMLLCMPTMGFHLASTRHGNIITARSYRDYLEKQVKQVEMLKTKGEQIRPVKSQRFIRQNILVGLVLHALGLYPFYDVFITNREHPEGFAEPQAEQEALLRALSAGPVGIGDKLGFIDKRIIERLTLPDGRLAKPDRPPRPLVNSLNSDILIAQTETAVGSERWRYLLFANVSEEESPYEFDPAWLGAKDRLIYDCLEGQLVEAIAGALPPAGVRCFLLAPKWGQVGLIGLEGRYVPLPCGLLHSLHPGVDLFQLQLEAQPGLVYPLAVWSKTRPTAQAQGGEVEELLPKAEGITVIIVRAEERLLRLEVQVQP